MKRLFIIFAAIATVVACSKEQENPSAKTTEPAVQENLVPMEFTAVGDTDTKNSLSGNSIVWSTSDKIKVFSGDNFETASQFTVSSTESEGHVATFSGLAEVSPAYYALFPYQEGASITSGGTISATLPANQGSIVAGSFGTEANLSVAHNLSESGATELIFKNVGALLSVTVEATDVTGIRIEALGENKYLSGTADINYNSGAPTFSVTSGNNYVEGTVSGAGTYYFVVFPGEYSGFRITLTKSGYSASMTSSESASLARNTKVSLGTIPEDIPWMADFSNEDALYIRNNDDTVDGDADMQFTYMADDYWNTTIVGAGDNAAYEGQDYTYELFARIQNDKGFYFESENGAKFAFKVTDGNLSLKRISSNSQATYRVPATGVYRIRINPVNRTAYLLKVGLVRLYFNYCGDSYLKELTYQNNGVWKIKDTPIRWGVWQHSTCETRYFFSIWFNGDHSNGNVSNLPWQRYGEYGPYYASHKDSDYDQTDYYWVRPYYGESKGGDPNWDWNLCYYLKSNLYDSTFNGRYSADITLTMNASGHYSHSFTNITDNLPHGESMQIYGNDSNDVGQYFNYISSSTFTGNTTSTDILGDVPGQDYDYEIFTKLSENSPVYFQSSRGFLFTIDNGVVKPISSASEAVALVGSDQGGVYRIRLNMANKTLKRKHKVTSVYVYYPYDNNNICTLDTYESKGQWLGHLQLSNLKKPWDNNTRVEERYRFKVVLDDGSSETVQDYGRQNGDGGRFADDAAANLYYVSPSSNGSWDNTFKLPSYGVENSGPKFNWVTVRLSMNAESDNTHYRHSFDAWRN